MYSIDLASCPQKLWPGLAEIRADFPDRLGHSGPRGIYSFAELAAMDACADTLGMEMFACLETLGHLEQILQWPRFASLQEASGVILVDDEATYALLAEMSHAASAPFRSRRIHLGLDEAWKLGSGRYRDLHGAADRPLAAPYHALAKQLEAAATRSSRLETLQDRLGDFLEGRIEGIPELAAPRLRYPTEDGALPEFIHARLKTPSAIK